jgi:hypothetical protein
MKLLSREVDYATVSASLAAEVGPFPLTEQRQTHAIATLNSRALISAR